MKKIRVAIIGMGVVGTKRKFFLSKNKKYLIKYISDNRFKKDFTKNNIAYYKNYKKIPFENIDAVFVTLPNYLAPKVTIYFLEKKIHVFCEKPPGRNVQDVRDVLKVFKKNTKIKLKYGFNHRYHKSVVFTKNIIDSKKLGNLVNIRAIYGKSKILNFSSSNWRSDKKFAGGGILLDQGIHMLDLLKYFNNDSSFQEYKSFISNKFWGYNVEDNAFAIMRSKNGVISSIHSTATQWQHKFNMEITFSNGAIILEGILSGTKTYGKETLKIFPGAKPYLYKGKTAKTKKFYFNKDTSWSDEIDEFAEVINKNKQVKYGDIYDSLAVMIMIDKIYKNDKKINNVRNR
jgi:predicted dehydrogenase